MLLTAASAAGYLLDMGAVGYLPDMGAEGRPGAGAGTILEGTYAGTDGASDWEGLPLPMLLTAASAVGYLPDTGRGCDIRRECIAGAGLRLSSRPYK